MTGVFSSKKNSCYFCDFADISGSFLASFVSKSWFLLDCYFCDICQGCFQLGRKILVTFTIFADISGSFLASFFSKSWFLLDLLFLRFLRYLKVIFWRYFFSIISFATIAKKFPGKFLLTRSILDPRSIIVEQILQAIIPTGHTFDGQCTARLRNLDTAIGGSS